MQDDSQHNSNPEVTQPVAGGRGNGLVENVRRTGAHGWSFASWPQFPQSPALAEDPCVGPRLAPALADGGLLSGEALVWSMVREDQLEVLLTERRLFWWTPEHEGARPVGELFDWSHEDGTLQLVWGEASGGRTTLALGDAAQAEGLLETLAHQRTRVLDPKSASALREALVMVAAGGDLDGMLERLLVAQDEVYHPGPGMMMHAVLRWLGNGSDAALLFAPRAAAAWALNPNSVLLWPGMPWTLETIAEASQSFDSLGEGHLGALARVLFEALTASRACDAPGLHRALAQARELARGDVFATARVLYFALGVVETSEWGEFSQAMSELREQVEAVGGGANGEITVLEHLEQVLVYRLDPVQASEELVRLARASLTPYDPANLRVLEDWQSILDDVFAPALQRRDFDQLDWSVPAFVNAATWLSYNCNPARDIERAWASVRLSLPSVAQGLLVRDTGAWFEAVGPAFTPGSLYPWLACLLDVELLMSEGRPSEALAALEQGAAATRESFGDGRDLYLSHGAELEAYYRARCQGQAEEAAALAATLRTQRGLGWL